MSVRISAAPFRYSYWIGFLTLVLLFQLGLGQKGIAQPSEELAIKELLKVTWPKAIVDKDKDQLDLILNDDYEKMDALGNWFNKESAMSKSYISLFAPDSIIVEVTRVRFMGIRNALAVTRSIEVSNNEEGRYSTSYWSSHLLERRERSWKVVSTHVSGRKISKPAKHEDKF